MRGKNDCFWRAMKHVLQQQLVKNSMCIDSIDDYFPDNFLDIFQESNEVVRSLTAWEIYNKETQDDSKGEWSDL